MSEQIDKLNEIHDLLIDDLLGQLKAGEASNDTRRIALQLLKQSSISAVVTDGSPLKSLSGKLDFSAIQRKVVPINAEKRQDAG